MKSIGRFLRVLALLLLAGQFIATSGAQAPPVRIMPLGDSLTFGFNNGNTFQGGYRNRLYSLLTAAGYTVDFVGTQKDSNNPGLPDTDHQGHSGYRIDQIQSELQTWLNATQDPDVVLLMIGTNDFSQNFNLASVQTRLMNLIADISARRPFAKIIVSSLLLRTDNQAFENLQLTYNAAIPSIVANQASLGREVTFVDLHAALVAADLGDGVHPTKAGYDKMADAWFPAITSVISPLGTANPPAIVRTEPPIDLNHVTIRFSKPLADSAANIANFSISGGVSVTQASLNPLTKRSITLTTSNQAPGTLYTISVTGVRDRTAAQTLIAAGSSIAFSSDVNTNGSFESDFTAWTRSGNMEIKSTAPYVPTDGAKLLAFGTAQSAPNGVLIQSFTTTVGTPYLLTFDAGTLGNNAEARVEVSVVGSSSLVSQTIGINGPGGSNTRWTQQAFGFVANTTTTTLTFTDKSVSSQDRDLVLDNVRVTAQVPRTLTVNSTPSNGINVAMSPADINGASGAPTGFSRQYVQGTIVTITAPATAAASAFVKWQRNGVDFSTSTAINVTMDTNYTLTAVYAANNQMIVNGSFESGYTGWTATGNQEIRLNTAPYSASEGSRLVGFNGGNTTPNGVLSQSFPTVSGVAYTLEFDAGLLSYNTNPQRIQVTLTGATPRFSQVVSVTGNGKGTSQYFPQTFSFVADSSTTTLTFRDQSTTTSGIDLLLDNVRVTGPPVLANNPPLAVPDSYTTNRNNTLVVAAPGLLSNDTDVESDPLSAVIATNPAHGTVTVNLNGGFTYTPATGYSGPDSFTYRATDGSSNSNAATVSITVNEIASGALANGSFEEGSPVDFGTLAGWTVTGDALGYTEHLSGYDVKEGNGVRLALFSAGDDDFSGDISQTVATTQGQTYALSLDMGVTGVAGKKQRLLVTVTNESLGGTVLLSSQETITSTGIPTLWAPRNSYTFVATGPTTTIRLEDDSNTLLSGERNFADLLLDNVILEPASGPVNNPPVATADSYSTSRNIPLIVPAAGVLSNDTDVESSPLTAALVAGPANGTLTLNPNGGFTYTPATDYIGPDSFTYRANDGTLNSANTTVSIIVNEVVVAALVNGSFELGAPADFGTLEGWTVFGRALGYSEHLPSYDVKDGNGVRLALFNAGDDDFSGVISQSFATTAGQTYALSFDMGVTGVSLKQQRLVIDVINGPVDGGGTSLLSKAETITSTGSATFWAPTKSYTFTATGATSTVRFKDDSGALAVGTANFADLLLDNVAVAQSVIQNTAPVAVADSYTTDEDAPLVVPAAGVLINDTDAQSDPLTAALVSGPANGTLTLNPNGSFTYTPAADFNGPDSFSYRANDGTLNSTDAVVSITVNPVNDAPVAEDDSYQAVSNTPLVIAAIVGVLDNDVDQEMATLTASKVSDPASGTLTFNSNGGFTYTPNPGFTGDDSFTYRASDGSLDSNVATVSINVGGLVSVGLVNGSFELGTPANFGPLDGWTMGGSPIGYTSTAPSYVVKEGNGSRLAIFNAGGNVFTSKVSQSFPTTPNAVYSVSLDLGITGTSGKMQALLVSVIDGTVDGGGDILLSQSQEITATGSATLWIAPLSYTFTATGTTSTLILQDNSGTLSGTITNEADMLLDNVQVLGPPAAANNAPVAAADSYSTTRNTALVVAAPGVLGNDTDAQSSPLTATIGTPPAHGTLQLAANGGFTYTPAQGYTGPDSFTYRANDGSLNSNIATVSLTVVNPAPVALLNGSFELGSPADFGALQDWTTSGTAVGYTENLPGYDVKDGNGVRVALFNGGSNTFTGDISQSFTTTPGATYTLTFDLGITGINLKKQRLLVDVTDGLLAAAGTSLLSEAPEITATGNPTFWAPTASYEFTAASTTTTLRFRDGSGTLGITAQSADLLLDNVRLSLPGANSAPVAVADSYTTVQGSPLVVAAPGVLGNDTDTELDPLTATIDTQPANGTLTLSPNGGFTYTPTAGYTGPDSFSYHANDGSSDSNIVMVSITVNAPAPSILVNGSFESDYAGWTPTGNQVVRVADTLYLATDGTKLVGFNGGNTAPNGVLSQTFATTPGVTYTLDFDAGVLTFSTAQQRLRATVTGNGSLLDQLVTVGGTNFGGTRWTAQTFTFLADSNSATLTFRDESLTSNSLDLLLDNVRISGGPPPTNTAPVAVVDSYSTPVNTALVVPAAGVLSNDTDAQLNSLTAILVSGPSNGTLTLNPNGGFTYTPTGGYTGPDSFTYKANDGQVDSNVVTVSLTVQAAALPVSLVNGSFELGTPADFGPLNGWTTAGTAVGYTEHLPNYDVKPGNGTRVALFNAGGDDFTGVISQSFATTPGQLYSLSFDMGITGTAGKKQRLVVDVIDGLVGGGPSILSLVEEITATGNPTLWAPTKSYTFTAAGTTTTLRFKDDAATLVSGAATFSDLLLDNVRASLPSANTAPAALADTYSTQQNVALVVAASQGVLANDTDASPLAADLGTGPANGTLTLNPDGSFTYTPLNNFTGTDSFTYVANDGDLTSAFTTVTITVTPTGGLVNGSFESGLAPWTISGGTVDSVKIKTSASATDGANMIEFNSANSPAGGVLTQAFITVPNTTYTLSFDLGVLAYNTNQQRLKVDVTGSGSLLSQTATINGINNGTVKWTPVSYTFTANSTNTTLTFTDVSTTTNSLDMLLDNVRVLPPGTVVVPPTTNLVTNGSFETNVLTPWTKSGGTADSVKINGTITATNGTKLIEFNSGGSPVGGVLTQSFATTPGATYSLLFDLGVVAFNTNQQRLQVSVTGNGSLLSETATINGIGNGTVKWEPRSYSFIANSTTSALSFTDVSTSGNSIDMLLDHVRIALTSGPSPAPVAVGDLYATPQNTALAVPAPGVLANDVDAQSDPMTAVLVAAPANGTVTLNPNGSFNYTPPSGFTGSTTFTYRASDGTNTSAITTVTINVVAVVATNLVNGSFESFFSGWTKTGSVAVEAGGVYAPTNGTIVVSFNGDNHGNGGVLSQTVSTTPGLTYALQFDAGVLAYNNAEQKMLVSVVGNGSLLSQTITLNGLNTNGTRWVPQTFTFVANSSSSIISFTDTSTTTSAIDLLLDHVRIAAVETQVNLTVESQPVGLNITVSPNDLAGNGNGVTPITRSYNNGAVVTLTAPATAGAASFIKWQRNGADFSTTAATSVTLTASSTMTAIYAVPGSNPLVNGSFETGTFSPWTKSGGTADSVKINGIIAGTQGSKIVEFNSANSPVGGVLTQTFPTTIGATYSLLFDIGVLAYNTNQQRLKVDVTGNGSLLSQTATINGINNGTVKWEPRSYTFTANTASTVLTFTDVSTSTSSLDLLLDNVRVQALATLSTASATGPTTATATAPPAAALTVAPAPVPMPAPSLAGGPGDFTVSMEAVEPGTYFLERSEDLKIWTRIGEELQGPGPLEFHDAEASALPSQPKAKVFYRIGHEPAGIDK